MTFDSFTSFLAAAAPAQNPGGSSTPLIMMVLMFVIMYFLIIRPQKLRQKELENRISQLKSGDKIITTAGLHGLVTNVKERTIMVKVDNNVKLEFEKNAVATIIAKDATSAKSEASTASDETDEESA